MFNVTKDTPSGLMDISNSSFGAIPPDKGSVTGSIPLRFAPVPSPSIEGLRLVPAPFPVGSEGLLRVEEQSLALDSRDRERFLSFVVFTTGPRWVLVGRMARCSSFVTRSMDSEVSGGRVPARWRVGCDD